MTRNLVTICSGLFIGFLAVDGKVSTAAGNALVDAHAYFNALVARPDHWKSFSLRDHEQMLAYRHSSARPLGVTYDPANDTYPKRQDAAKVTIPEFNSVSFADVAQPLSRDAVTLTLTATNAAMTASLTGGRAIQIDREIVVVERVSGVPITGSTVGIKRGQNGTAAAAHAAGASVALSANSLLNQLRLPMDTEDGQTYLVTWDAWYGPEFHRDRHGFPNYKTFHFLRADHLWLQVDTRFSEATGTDIGVIGGRALKGGNRTWEGAYGPNVEDDAPLSPRLSAFAIKPSTWTRYWVQIVQRANAYDRVSLWIADETRDAELVFDALELNVGTDPINRFLFEFNTSNNALKPGRGALVAYVRNWVALRNAGNPAPLLKRPGAAVPLPPLSTPLAPKNVRIIPE